MISDESTRSHKKKKRDRDRDKGRGDRDKDKEKDRKRRHHSTTSDSNHHKSSHSSKSENVIKEPTSTSKAAITSHRSSTDKKSIKIESASTPNTTSNNCKSNNLPHIVTLTELSNHIKKEQDNDTEQRKLFISPVETTLERKPDSNLFVKKEYLQPSTKVDGEKSREDVTRALHFGEADTAEKSTNQDGRTVAKGEPGLENKENANKMDFKVNHMDKIMGDVKVKHENKISNRKPEKTSGHIHTNSKDHHKESKSSSTSSSRRSSSSSNRECSKCYKRSKIKKVNTGIQCKRYDPPIVPVATPKNNFGAINRDVNWKRDGLKGYKYGQYFHVEVHSVSLRTSCSMMQYSKFQYSLNKNIHFQNGGAAVVHMYQSEIDALSKDQMDELVEEFFQLTFSEDDDGNAFHVMGIVHDAAAYLPDLLEHMAENYSTLTVKAGVMGRNSDIETLTMSQYNEQVNEMPCVTT